MRVDFLHTTEIDFCQTILDRHEEAQNQLNALSARPLQQPITHQKTPDAQEVSCGKFLEEICSFSSDSSDATTAEW